MGMAHVWSLTEKSWSPIPLVKCQHALNVHPWRWSKPPEAQSIVPPSRFLQLLQFLPFLLLGSFGGVVPLSPHPKQSIFQAVFLL